MISTLSVLHFARLERRLLEALRRRIANGETTERRLARQVGLSQPHVHNVLKGARALTPAVADLLMEGVGLSALDLVQTTELWDALRSRSPMDPGLRHVAVVEGRVSTQDPFPDLGERTDWLCLPASITRTMGRPVFVKASLDDEVHSFFPDVEVALIDTDESARVIIVPGQWYVVRIDGVGLFRQIRRENHRLILLGQTGLFDSRLPSMLTVHDGSVLQFIRGRVGWMGRDPRRLDHLAIEWPIPAAL